MSAEDLCIFACVWNIQHGVGGKGGTKLCDVLLEWVRVVMVWSDGGGGPKTM